MRGPSFGRPLMQSPGSGGQVFSRSPIAADGTDDLEP